MVRGLPRPSSLQLGIEISGKTMGARGLMRIRITDEGLWKSQVRGMNYSTFVSLYELIGNPFDMF